MNKQDSVYTLCIMHSSHMGPGKESLNTTNANSSTPASQLYYRYLPYRSRFDTAWTALCIACIYTCMALTCTRSICYRCMSFSTNAFYIIIFELTPGAI